MKPILNIENLTKIYGNVPSQTNALNGITLQVMPGEFLGIMGSSGSAHRWKHSGGGRYSAIPQGKGSCRVPWQKSWLSIPEL